MRGPTAAPPHWRRTNADLIGGEATPELDAIVIRSVGHVDWSDVARPKPPEPSEEMRRREREGVALPQLASTYLALPVNAVVHVPGCGNYAKVAADEWCALENLQLPRDSIQMAVFSAVTLVSLPAPEWLTTVEDYERAPVGTVVESLCPGNDWRKGDGGWRECDRGSPVHGNYPGRSAFEMVLRTARRVVRWGPG